MSKKYIFLRIFQTIALFACVFCAFFVSPVFANLPAGYTELEYIESTGTQYIDMGVSFSRNNEFYFEFEKIVALSGENKGYGAGTNYLIDNISSGGRIRNGVFQPWVFNGDLPYSPTIPSSDWYGKKYIETFTTYNNQISFVLTDNSGNQYRTTSRTLPSNWQSTGNNVFLFRDSVPTHPYPSHDKVYRVWLKKDGEFIRNMIPARRNSDGEIGMYDMVSGQFFANVGTGAFIAGPVVEIKIATTKMVDEEFKAAELKLAETVEMIDDVVSRTITQTEQIATLQSEKQTRPDETCPAGKKCLLVMDENDIPHWYEIIEAVYDFVANWFTPFNSAGRPTFHYTTDTSSGSTIWTSYNGFYKGDSAFRKNYIDGSTSTYDRPFAHATRCNTDFKRTTDSREASMCYPETGVFKTLTDGEWAIVYNGDEGTSTKKVPASVVYGTSKCTSVAGPNNYATSNPTKFSELTPEQQLAWAELPALHGQPERAGYNSDDYKQCWCKMTALGIPNSGETIASGQSTAGTIYPLPESSSAWVFDGTYSSAALCAYDCASICARSVRGYSGFRAAVLSWQ